MPTGSNDLRHDVVGLDGARNTLFAVWGFGGGLIMLILVVQSLLGHYGGKVQDVWGWFLPTIMPTLSMIFIVLGYSALEDRLSKAVVRRSYYHAATWLSLVYIVLILLTILVQPFASAEKAVELMIMSNLWLGPVQGIVSSALGVMFITKETESGEGV
jgi:hypothetical protein